MAGSSSAAVTGLSGFAGAFSSFELVGLGSAGVSLDCRALLSPTDMRSSSAMGALSRPTSSFSVPLPLTSATAEAPFVAPSPLDGRLSAVVAIFATGSTGTKLARTLLVCRDPFSLSLPNPLGDLPRESDESVSRLALFSKIERRLRTAEEERCSEDMAIAAQISLWFLLVQSAAQWCRPRYLTDRNVT